MPEQQAQQRQQEQGHSGWQGLSRGSGRSSEGNENPGIAGGFGGADGDTFCLHPFGHEQGAGHFGAAVGERFHGLHHFRPARQRQCILGALLKNESCRARVGKAWRQGATAHFSDRL
jgi:hypothetical protein